MNRVGLRLWMGAHPAEKDLRGFDVWVQCAAEFQSPSPAPGLRVIHCPLIDDGYSLSKKEADLAVAVAKEAAVAIQDGKRVLISCTEGRNRSGLVMALTLQALKPDMPMRFIIEHIRTERHARGPVLSNERFVRFLRAYSKKAYAKRC